MDNNEIQKHDFEQVVNLIITARENTLKKVNEELVLLYWNIGKNLSSKAEISSWGDSYIEEMAQFIREKCPNIKGFTRRGLYRMKQFYEAYKDNEIVSAVLTQISWTNHLAILSSTKLIDKNLLKEKLHEFTQIAQQAELKNQLQGGS